MLDSERILPLFPLNSVVLFPGASIPLQIFEDRYKRMLKDCMDADSRFGICLIKSGQHRASWSRMHEDNPDYSLDDHWRKLSQAVPLGRVGEADEAGDVICFLASPKASYVTGASLNIDGGMSPVV